MLTAVQMYLNLSLFWYMVKSKFATHYCEYNICCMKTCASGSILYNGYYSLWQGENQQVLCISIFLLRFYINSYLCTRWLCNSYNSWMVYTFYYEHIMLVSRTLSVFLCVEWLASALSTNKDIPACKKRGADCRSGNSFNYLIF